MAARALVPLGGRRGVIETAPETSLRVHVQPAGREVLGRGLPLDAASLSKYDAGIAREGARETREASVERCGRRRRGTDEPNPNRGVR